MNNYIQYLICKAHKNTIYGMTATSRGYGKTMTTRALYIEIMSKFARYYKYIG